MIAYSKIHSILQTIFHRTALFTVTKYYHNQGKGEIKGFITILPTLTIEYNSPTYLEAFH